MGFFTERLGSLGATIGNIWPGIERANFEKSRIQTEKELANTRLELEKGRLDLATADRIAKESMAYKAQEEAATEREKRRSLKYPQQYKDSALAASIADGNLDYEKFRNKAWEEYQDQLKPRILSDEPEFRNKAWEEYQDQLKPKTLGGVDGK